MSRRPTRKKAPRGRTRTSKRRFLLRYGWIFPLVAVLIGGALVALVYGLASIPLPNDIKLTSSAQVFDRNGKLIGTYSGSVRRFLLTTEQLDKLPEYVGQAVVAAEDKEFYEHGAVSFKGIVRAAWADITGGEIQQGGSTISQQYIKNAVLQDASRTVTRKAKEAILAIKLERRYSKDQILGFYLNTIYLGRGAYGIEAAARSYFNKHAEDLSLPQAAFLASIIPAPSAYQPTTNPEGAKARRDRVLNLMAEQGYISETEAQRYSRRRVKVVPHGDSGATRQRAAYFMEWLRRDYLQPEFGDRLYTGGLKIYTTLDLDMQAEAEDAVASVLTEPDDPQAALVSITPKGEVRAFVGGREFTNIPKARGFNYASDPPGRQAGSAFKPFTLATALQEGVSPQTYFSGRSPVVIDDLECSSGIGKPWMPENFEGSQYGTVSLDQATTSSVNTVYAQLIARVGPEKVAEDLMKFGFDGNNFTEEQDDIEPTCSLALGTLDVTPVQMARAYAAFSSGGRLAEVQPLRYILGPEERCLREYRPDDDATRCREESSFETTQAMPPNEANILTQVLTHVVQAGTATAARLPDGRPVAGKTGTTQNHENAWFAGYVRQLTTVVWMGYPLDPGPDGKIGGKAEDDFIPLMQYCSDTDLCRPVHGIEVAGGTFPAQIWAAYMGPATAEMEPQPFATPTAGVVPAAPVDPEPDYDYEPAPLPPVSPRPRPVATPPRRRGRPAPTAPPSYNLPPLPGGTGAPPQRSPAPGGGGQTAGPKPGGGPKRAPPGQSRPTIR